MANKKQLQPQEYSDFGKGINTFTKEYMLKENECADGFNVWATGKNSIKKRTGIVKLCTVAGASKIDGLGSYYQGTTRKLLAMAGGVLYSVETGTAVALSAAPVSANVFTSGNRTDFCQAGGNLFIANGVEAIRKFDGTTVREQTGAVVAKWMIFYKACLWAGGNPTAGNEAKLYRSGDGSSGTAEVGNFTYGATANPLATTKYVSQSDGQWLNGIFKHQDYLYPVKERSLWRASVGTDASMLITLEMVDPARGCDSHWSIDTVDNDNFMFSENGVLATGYEPNILDQIRTNIVSLRVDTKLKAIQKSRLDEVVGIYFDNHYYLSYTSGGGTFNDTVLVYDRQRLGWWEWQFSDIDGNSTGANCFNEFKNSAGQTYLCFGSATDGSIYYFDDTSKQDSGWTISSVWRSPKFSFKDYARMKFFLQAQLLFGAQPGDITINVYIENAQGKSELAGSKTISIGTTGFAGIGIDSIGVSKIGVEGGSLDAETSAGGWVKIPLTKMGRNIQIEITDNSGTKGWELNAIKFLRTDLADAFQPGNR